MKPALPSLRQVLENHDLWAKKSLGQNFLLDPDILSRIVKVAGDLDGRTVIEIGPGPGGLTREILLKNIQKLFVVEKDKRCIDIMTELQEYYPDTLEILPQDALELNCATLGEAPRKIISNLPYNISVPLLLKWLTTINHFESLTLMFQKEVAKRICAKPRSSDYGRLSVMTQWCCEPYRLFDLPPGAFRPSPKVTSTVLQLKPKAKKMDVTPLTLEKVTAAAFNQRRKMLRSSLKQLLPDPLPLLQTAGIDSSKRAEELSVEEFCWLSQLYDDLKKSGA